MAVTMTMGTGLEVGTPQALFGPDWPTQSNYYSVTADGQRFFIGSLYDQTAGSAHTVVINWTAELER
jgi:hypothetical protein